MLTTLPDVESARALARTLVERRLAACVTTGAAVESMYHWQGGIETAREIQLSAKTRESLFDDVAATIRELHPYELPEIVAVPIQRGLREYLDWIDANTR